MHSHPMTTHRSLNSLLFSLALIALFVACGTPKSICKNDRDCVSEEYCQSSRCFAKCKDSNECDTGETCQSSGKCAKTIVNHEPAPKDGGNPDNTTPNPDNTNPNPDKNPPIPCGNNVVEFGEECDGTELNSQTCQTKGFTGGTLKCTQCKFDTSSCTNTNQPQCNNNIIEAGEECDGTQLNNQTCKGRGFDDGTIKCTQCKIDTSGCTNAGGKKKFGQLCEKSTDCETGAICVIAKDGDKGYCAATCSQTKPCPTTPPNAKCALRAGENTICGWECSPGASGQCPTGLNCNAIGSSFYCTGSPAPIPPKCNNNKIETGEECDGTELNNQTCQTQGFVGGTLKCKGCIFDTSGCTGSKPSTFGKNCKGPSDCDTGQICVAFTSTQSICTANCSASQPCPTTPPGASCRFKLQSGGSICGWATASGAPPICGNGSVEAGEDCDKTQLQSTCKGLGFSGGTLKCSSTCTFDTSSCTGQTKCPNLPSTHCKAGCASIIRFSPDIGVGYNVTHGDRYSWLARTGVMSVKYATAAVKCVFPGSSSLGLGDMSMSNGNTPADTSGQLRHPSGTHTQGHDIDLAYYQVNTANNNLRPICNHVLNGKDQYHCIAKPHLLDAVRSAFFISKILESGKVRVIGIDGQAGVLIKAAMAKLYQDGMISKLLLDQFNGGAVTWEETDEKRGWFLFHHHHIHISYN